MKKNLLLFFLLFSGYHFAFAQTKVITGKVIDSKDGSPIPGVSVIVKDVPSVGTQTDPNGSYSISVPAGTHSLVFKYIGYKESIIPIKGNVLNVQLEVDPKQLTEVVVVGYGTQKRANITGAITSVTAKDVANTPVTTFEQALQGKTSGVNIQANNGKLGQGVSINIRGVASISGTTQPLIVMDGIVINQADLSSNGAATNPLADINFNDIESFEILKDASASAIYGSRASAGVILITTKRGKAGTAKIDINAQFGYDQPSRHRQFLNSQQWLQIEERAGVGAAKQDYAAGLYDSLSTALADYKSYVEGEFTALAAGNTNWASTNTDWEKQAFQTAPHQQYDLNFSGGNDKTTYYFGGQALNQTGILKGNAFQRYSGRVNVDTKISSTFDAGINLNFTHTYNERIANDDNFNTPLQIVALSPITPVIDPRSGLISGTPPGASSSYPLYYNPLVSVDNEYFHTNVYRTLGNMYANWEIVKHLTFHSDLGVDQLNQNEDSYANSLTARNTGTNHGSGTNAENILVHFTINNYLTYKNTFNKDNTLDVTVGTGYENNHSTANSVSGQQFPSDAYKTIASAALINAGTSTQSASTLISYFARTNYAYKNKYLLSASIRADGSSNFGVNNRYGYFPGGSLGWVASEEDFMKSLTAISSLKIRASYGLTGDNGVPNYSALGLFSGSTPSGSPAGYNGAAGQRYAQIANPNLKWATTSQLNLGIDWGLFNNRLSGSVDYYKKNTSNLFLNVNIPETSGIATQLQNLGKLYNQGFEFLITSENFIGKFRWSTSFNAAYNKNKVTYTAGQQIAGGSDLNYVIEGQQVGVFYGRQYAGVDPANGDALYYLNTKNADGSVNHGTTNNFNDAQNVVLGNAQPDWTGGITNNFSYKGFDLSFTFYGSFGNQIYNGGGQYMSAEASNGFDNQTVDQLKYWNKPGDITNVPEPRLFYANGTGASSRYLSSGSYVRLKSATIGYNIPKSVLSKIKVDRARVFVNGYNLFLITNYKGWDPEVNTDFLASNINLGNDFYSAPQPRTITFGLNVGL
ncbi:SusC/RagA family TonB-linked outer membrane protein [Mucilaginibacter sp. McL0603]|uniref:SusC/RagA family TonB-linked outer membrane protein n=1 Tax=Mucilaginibacter sp. McL0603 TaxID=3415670 RepID=UPI003CF2A1F9